MRQLGQSILLVVTLLSVSFCSVGSDEEAGLQGVDLIVVINGQFNESPTFGSGIIFAREKDQLYIVTANHVVRSGGADARNLHIRLKPWPDKVFEARLLPQSDRELDLAALTVNDLAAQGVNVCKLSLDRLADPATVKRGEEVYPVGNPNGVAWGMPVMPDAISDATGDSVTFQSTLIARGHSGGGLLGTSGQLIGMIQADEPPYGRALGMGKVLEVLRAWNLPVQLRVQLPDGVTPLLGAAGNGDLNEARLLLREACTDVNERVDDETPLGVALRRGRGEIAKLLVEAGAEVNSQNSGGTPLDEAARSGNAEIVEFLISHGTQVNSCCALAAASSSGALDVVKVLLAHGADPNRVGVNFRNQTPLFSAIGGEERKRQAAQDEVLQALIKAGAKVNWADGDGDTPLTLAVEHLNPGAVRTLLEAGAKVDVKNRNKDSPIRLVTYLSGAPISPALREIAALLVEFSSKVEQEDGLRLLEQASEEGWAEVADMLVKHGVNVRGDGGNRALEGAAENGHSEVVKVLLEAGADPNGAGRPTPLVSVLGGVDPREMSKMDPAKRLAMVKMLVSKGAKVNVYPDVPDLSYMEPLYLALIKLTPPDLKVAEVLIAHGAKVNASLLDTAMYVRRPEVVEFVRRTGAKRGPSSH